MRSLGDAAVDRLAAQWTALERIRHAHFRKGASIRESATLHHSRDTIRRALVDPGPWTYRRSRRRPVAVMDAVAPIVTTWLEADTRVHRKQRHAARRIFVRLKAGALASSIATASA